MIITKKTKVAVLATAIVGMAAASASAANTYTPGDLILGFQQVGNTNTVLVDLGDTSSVFRDTNSGSISLTNIGSLLSATFGANWFEQSNVYFGAVGVWSNSDFSTDPTLRNGDPGSTVYITKARTAAGVEGVKQSTLANLSSNGALITVANNAVALQQTYANGTGNVFPTSQANTWEDFNPVSGGTQGTAFGSYAGGIQQAFGAGAFATYSVGSVEGALDLYRVDGADDATIPGAYHSTTNNRQGEFQGILTIDNLGNVSFDVTPVPEPGSVLALVGAVALGLGFRRNRSAIVAA